MQSAQLRQTDHLAQPALALEQPDKAPQSFPVRADLAFCQATEYCDADHPRIQCLAAEITAGLTNDTERAVAIFYWVRDRLNYRVGHWNTKASEAALDEEGTRLRRRLAA